MRWRSRPDPLGPDDEKAFRDRWLAPGLVGLMLLIGVGLALVLPVTAASDTSKFPGSWTLTNGKVVDTETNNSGQAVRYFYLVLPTGVTISAGTVAGGYECVVGQPSSAGGQNVIECAAPPPGYWANGSQLVLTLTVTGLTGTPTFEKHVSYDGTTYDPTSYPVPYSSGSTTTTTTTTITTTTTTTETTAKTTTPPGKPACKCVQLLAKAFDFGFLHEGDPFAPPGGPVIMLFRIRWTLTCTKGHGGCVAILGVVPPAGHKARVAISQTQLRNCKSCPIHFKTPTPGVSTIICTGKCGEAVTGVALVRIVGDNTLDAAHIANTDLIFTVMRTCQDKPLRRQLLDFRFGAHGRFDPARSHL